MVILLMGCLYVQEEWRGEVVEVSWVPRAFLLKNFLSDKECQHFINKVSLHVWKPPWVVAVMMSERSTVPVLEPACASQWILLHSSLLNALLSILWPERWVDDPRPSQTW